MSKSQKGKRKDQSEFLTLAFKLTSNILPHHLGRFTNQSVLNCLFNQSFINGKEEQAEITKSINLLLYNCLCTNDQRNNDFNKKLDRIMLKHKLRQVNSFSENEETHVVSNELDSNLNDESSNSDNKTIKISKLNDKNNEESDNNTISISDNTSFGLTHGSSSNNIRTSLKKQQKPVEKNKKETTIHYKPKFEKMGVKFKKDMIVKNSEKLLPASFNNEVVNSTCMSNITNIVKNNNTVVENTVTMTNFYYPSDPKYVYENSTTKKVTYRDLMLKNKNTKESINYQTSQKNSINSNKPNSNNQQKQFVQKKPFEVSLKPNSQSKDHRKLMNNRLENKKKPENHTNININIKELNIINNNKKLKVNEEVQGNKILDAKTIKEINNQGKSSKEEKMININLNIGSLNNINSKIPLKEPDDIGDELNDSDTNIEMITAKRKDALTPVFDHKAMTNSNQEFDERGTSNFGKRKFEDLQLLSFHDKVQLSEERFSFKNCVNSEREQTSENNSLFCNIKTRVINNNKLNFNINDDFEEENFNDLEFKNNNDFIYMLSKNKDIFDTKYIPDEEEYEENFNDSFANKEISFLGKKKGLYRKLSSRYSE